MSQHLGAEVKAMPIDIGIEEPARREIAGGLSRLLADTYTLYLKTHNFHWNVTGPMFQTLHLMFEQQYNELALAVDQIAERIRALGFPAPGSYQEFGRLTSIKEAEGVPAAEAMIRQLVEGQETVARTAREVIKVAEAAHDAPTADLLTERLQVHEKTAWMLRSLLATARGSALLPALDEAFDGFEGVDVGGRLVFAQAEDAWEAQRVAALVALRFLDAVEGYF
jgi:starvation-inducible DNA-binding protein